MDITINGVRYGIGPSGFYYQADNSAGPFVYDGTGMSVVNRSRMLASTASILTRPADTTPYAAGDLVASATVAGSVTVPNFAPIIGFASGAIPRMLLKSLNSNSLANVGATVRLWSAAPTYTNGDNGAYAVATGTMAFLAEYVGSFESFGDGGVAVLVPGAGSSPLVLGGASGPVYWDFQTGTAFTPISGEVFTLVPDIWN